VLVPVVEVVVVEQLDFEFGVVVRYSFKILLEERFSSGYSFASFFKASATSSSTSVAISANFSHEFVADRHEATSEAVMSMISFSAVFRTVTEERVPAMAMVSNSGVIDRYK
jgi:hypothetical protein